MECFYKIYDFQYIHSLKQNTNYNMDLWDCVHSYLILYGLRAYGFLLFL